MQTGIWLANPHYLHSAWWWNIKKEHQQTPKNIRDDERQKATFCLHTEHNKYSAGTQKKKKMDVLYKGQLM